MYTICKGGGDTKRIRVLKAVMTQVQGFDYVNENERTHVYISVAKKLKDIHFGINNFYNEPGQIKLLEDLGTMIPPLALKDCVTAILYVWCSLTYFLNYLLSISIDYFLCYQNLVHVEQLVKNKGAVGNVERTGEAGCKRFEISDFRSALSGIVNHQCGGAIGHVKVYVEGPAPIRHDVHWQAGSEKAGGVGVKGVPFHLMQFFPVAPVPFPYFDVGISHNISQGRMHIPANGNVERIAGLVGIHNVLFVV